MLSAMLLGYNVEVPEGQVGRRQLPHDPALHPRRPDRLRRHLCLLPRRAAPPPAGSLFGRAAAPGIPSAAPIRPRSAAPPPRRSIPTGSPPRALGAPRHRLVVGRAAAGALPAHRGLVSAACVNRGPLGYLAVTVNADPADARTDGIPGDVYLAGVPAPGWGLHLVDMNLAMGDLIRVVEAQRDAFLRRRR